MTGGLADFFYWLGSNFSGESLMAHHVGHSELTVPCVVGRRGGVGRRMRASLGTLFWMTGGPVLLLVPLVGRAG